MKTILILDVEGAIRDSIKMILEYEKLDVAFAEDGIVALERLRDHAVEAVLLDIKMPGEDGLKVLRKIRQERPDLPVIMISGHGTIETAVEATRLGAYDFLPKPLDSDKLVIAVRNAAEQHRLLTEYHRMREAVEGKDVILGCSPKMREVLSIVERVAPTDVRVLISGENGSGKELVAKAIQRLSKRNAKPFVEVNCAAIPNELIESELFGHERGAFTGAASQRIGKFELADGGTLFLDEIGDMSLNAQAKVLRALEEGKIERVGGNKQITVDVRVIAATNKNLAEAIRQNLFREDLYHRLNVIPVNVPPLRERREDIPLLAVAFAEDICRRNGMAPKRLSEEVLRRLRAMEWTGNVRELRNTVERLVIMTPGDVIEGSHLDPAPASTHRNAVDDLLSLGGTFQDFKDRAEAAFILQQLGANGWNISKTAEVLDIQRSHLYNKMKKYGLERQEGRARRWRSPAPGVPLTCGLEHGECSRNGGVEGVEFSVEGNSDEMVAMLAHQAAHSPPLIADHDRGRRCIIDCRIVLLSLPLEPGHPYPLCLQCGDCLCDVGHFGHRHVYRGTGGGLHRGGSHRCCMVPGDDDSMKAGALGGPHQSAKILGVFNLIENEEKRLLPPGLRCRQHRLDADKLLPPGQKGDDPLGRGITGRAAKCGFVRGLHCDSALCSQRADLVEDPAVGSFQQQDLLDFHLRPERFNDGLPSCNDVLHPVRFTS